MAGLMDLLAMISPPQQGEMSLYSPTRRLREKLVGPGTKGKLDMGDLLELGPLDPFFLGTMGLAGAVGATGLAARAGGKLVNKVAGRAVRTSALTAPENALGIKLFGKAGLTREELLNVPNPLKTEITTGEVLPAVEPTSVLEGLGLPRDVQPGPFLPNSTGNDPALRAVRPDRPGSEGSSLLNRLTGMTDDPGLQDPLNPNIARADVHTTVPPAKPRQPNVPAEDLQPGLAKPHPFVYGGVYTDKPDPDSTIVSGMWNPAEKPHPAASAIVRALDKLGIVKLTPSVKGELRGRGATSLQREYASGILEHQVVDTNKPEGRDLLQALKREAEYRADQETASGLVDVSGTKRSGVVTETTASKELPVAFQGARTPELEVTRSHTGATSTDQAFYPSSVSQVTAEAATTSKEYGDIAQGLRMILTDKTLSDDEIRKRIMSISTSKGGVAALRDILQDIQDKVSSLPLKVTRAGNVAKNIERVQRSPEVESTIRKIEALEQKIKKIQVQYGVGQEPPEMVVKQSQKRLLEEQLKLQEIKEKRLGTGIGTEQEVPGILYKIKHEGYVPTAAEKKAFGTTARNRVEQQIREAREALRLAKQSVRKGAELPTKLEDLRKLNEEFSTTVATKTEAKRGSLAGQLTPEELPTDVKPTFRRIARLKKASVNMTAGDWGHLTSAERKAYVDATLVGEAKGSVASQMPNATPEQVSQVESVLGEKLKSQARSVRSATDLEAALEPGDMGPAMATEASFLENLETPRDSIAAVDARLDRSASKLGKLLDRTAKHNLELTRHPRQPSGSYSANAGGALPTIDKIVMNAPPAVRARYDELLGSTKELTSEAAWEAFRTLEASADATPETIAFVKHVNSYLQQQGLTAPSGKVITSTYLENKYAFLRDLDEETRTKVINYIAKANPEMASKIRFQLTQGLDDIDELARTSWRAAKLTPLVREITPGVTAAQAAIRVPGVKRIKPGGKKMLGEGLADLIVRNRQNVADALGTMAKTLQRNRATESVRRKAAVGKSLAEIFQERGYKAIKDGDQIFTIGTAGGRNPNIGVRENLGAGFAKKATGLSKKLAMVAPVMGTGSLANRLREDERR